MNWLTRFFSRSDDDPLANLERAIEREELANQAFWDGVAWEQKKQRASSASYPDEEHCNVISICRHRSWIPRGAA